MQLLIDGNNMAFRVHYTHRNLTANGEPTGVLYGSIQSVRNFKEMFSNARIICCWDTRKNLRKKLSSEYKAKRKINSDRKRIFDQLPKLKVLLSTLGVSSTEYSGLEADDLLAILSKLDESIIVSNDEDLYQLLNSKVKMLKPKKKELYTHSDFVNEFNITSDKWAEVLAMAGKGSNDLKGLPGIGRITAIKYLRNKKIRDDLNKIIENNKHKTLENLALTTLPFKSIIPKIQRSTTNRNTFHRLCTQYRFTSILKEFKNWEQLFFK